MGLKSEVKIRKLDINLRACPCWIVLFVDAANSPKIPYKTRYTKEVKIHTKPCDCDNQPQELEEELQRKTLNLPDILKDVKQLVQYITDIFLKEIQILKEMDPNIYIDI